MSNSFKSSNTYSPWFGGGGDLLYISAIFFFHRYSVQLCNGSMYLRTSKVLRRKGHLTPSTKPSTKLNFSDKSCKWLLFWCPSWWLTLLFHSSCSNNRNDLYIFGLVFSLSLWKLLNCCVLLFFFI